VIAALTRVPERSPLLLVAVHLVDEAVDVDDLARARARPPHSRQRSAPDRADARAQRQRAQERAQRRGRRHPAAEQSPILPELVDAIITESGTVRTAEVRALVNRTPFLREGYALLRAIP
jgi:hypothetical protein